ncbi:MAG TPA: UvrD-helicase domain-containing protein [Thermoanaerobaculia bacterium]|jgi:exodeoxyribonuclease V beta subunit|nr:UvrD-helicase domain-containing protein [Thermoanaerobaculia bacterium]
MSVTQLAARPALLAAIPRQGHVVLEASAGTGKTYTLEHLVIDLLLTHGVPVERMLVVTFTEKATEELRERVRTKLRQLAAGQGDEGDAGDGWTLDADARQTLADAAVRFDAATISTIHGFCQRVLTEHSFAHRRLFEQRLIDGREMFARGFRTVISRQLGAGGGWRDQLLSWLRHGNELAQLEKLVADAVRQRGELTPTWDPAALVAAARAFLEACSDPLLVRAHAAAAVPARERADHDPRPAVAAFVASGDAEALGTALREWGRKKGQRRGDERRHWTALRQGLASLAGDAAAARALAAFDALGDLAAPPLAALVGGLRQAVGDWLRDQKRSLGLYDFDDMLLHVREALCGPQADPGLVAALRARWDVGLIDEFQDTDEVQWDIFRTLFLDGDAGRRLFLIGDPKQAIYGFRNADVHTYVRARREVVAGGGRLVPLLANYRSTPELIDACNRMFATGFFTGDLASFAPAVAGGERRVAHEGDGTPLSPLVVVRLRREGKPPRIADARAALATWIAGEARRLVESEATFGVEGQEQPLRYGDLMVLARTGAGAKEVAEALRQQGVPHVLFGQEGLLATPEAANVRRVLAAIAAPADPAARLQALLTPFFAVPLGELAGCRELPETHPLVARLLDWAALAEDRRYPALFRRLLRDSGLVRRLLVSREGERELTNFQHVFDLLLEEAARSPAPLPELVARLSGWIAGTSGPPGFDRDVQRLEPARDAVQLLTMHKAKGLEAPVVFVAGLGGQAPQGESLRVYHRGDERRLHLGKDPVGEVAEAIEAEEAEESQRLYYVALTRARARLYLPDACCRKGTPWRLVEGRLDALLAAGAPGFTVRQLECAPAAEPALPVPRQWTFDPAWLVTPPDPAAALAPLRRRHAGRLLTSYTRIRRGALAAAAVAAGDAAVEELTPPGLPPPPPGELVGGRGTGIFLHRLLEELEPEAVRAAPDLAAWMAAPAVLPTVRRVAMELGIADASLAPACRLVWSALRTPLMVDGLALPLGLCEAQRRAVEMELVFPIPEDWHPRLGEAPPAGGEAPFRAGRGFVQGVVDLVFEHGGRTYFVDWKTDRLASWSAAALGAHVDASYALQARLYALGVLRLLGLAGPADHEQRFGGLLYCFLRGMGFLGGMEAGAGDAGVYFARPSWDELRRWEDELRARTEWGSA